MAQSMLDMSLDEILAAGRAGGGAAAAAAGERGEGGGGRDGRDGSRRGGAFASRFPRRLPISKRGQSSSFFEPGSSWSSSGHFIGGWRAARGGRASSSFFQKWMGDSRNVSSRNMNSRWRGGRSSLGTESFLLAEDFEQAGERGAWRGRQQSGRKRMYDGDVAVVRAAAAAARTAADAAAEAAADAAGGDATMEAEDEWGRGVEARGGRRRRWNETTQREMYAADDIESSEVWENDRFGLSPACIPQFASSSTLTSGYNSNRRRGGRGTPWGQGAARYGGSYPRGFIRISNLDYTILEEDLKELFGAVGDVVKVWIDYDRTDRSKGTGGCIFRFFPDAERAIRIYEGKKIEGLPLHLELQVPGGGNAAVDNFNGVGGFFRSSNSSYNAPYERGGTYGSGRRGWRG